MKMKKLLFTPILLWITIIILLYKININLYDDILGNTRAFFYVFVAVNIVHVLYFLYIICLKLKKRTTNEIVLASLPPAAVVAIYILNKIFSAIILTLIYLFR